MLAVDDVTDAADGHPPGGHGDGVQIDGLQPLAPDLRGDEQGGQDDAAVEREAAVAQQRTAVLEHVEQPSADQTADSEQDPDREQWVGHQSALAREPPGGQPPIKMPIAIVSTVPRDRQRAQGMWGSMPMVMTAVEVIVVHAAGV